MEKEEMQSGKTNIQISNETWNLLNKLKLKPSETFEDIILRCFDQMLEDGLGIKPQKEEAEEVEEDEETNGDSNDIATQQEPINRE
jgi:predicted CopG family antitoxin